MRSRSALLLALALCASSAPAQPEPPSPEQVREATEAVFHHPDLRRFEPGRELRFKRDDVPPDERPSTNLDWWRAIVQAIAEGGRWAAWLLGAAAVALLLVYLRRWLAVRGDDDAKRVRALPSHVRDLDIRPESLPDDVGAAARKLWLAGDARAALSLLYRGALSRLVHEQSVPVRAASTEGECITLASRHARADSSAFFARLVALWQLAVYGAHPPESARVLALCDEFDASLPRRVAPEAAA